MFLFNRNPFYFWSFRILWCYENTGNTSVFPLSNPTFIFHLISNPSIFCIWLYVFLFLALAYLVFCILCIIFYIYFAFVPNFGFGSMLKSIFFLNGDFFFFFLLWIHSKFFLGVWVLLLLLGFSLRIWWKALDSSLEKCWVCEHSFTYIQTHRPAWSL